MDLSESLIRVEDLHFLGLGQNVNQKDGVNSKSASHDLLLLTKCNQECVPYSATWLILKVLVLPKIDVAPHPAIEPG